MPCIILAGMGQSSNRRNMQGSNSKYLAVETTSSGIVNALLNLAAAAAIFHGRTQIPTGGPTGLLKDLIGETFLVTSLSFLVPTLIARHRTRAGTLRISARESQRPPRNIYFTSFIVGLLFTLVFMPCNFWLLPRLFPNGVSFGNVLSLKTIYGGVLGAIATWMALRRALSGLS